MTKKRKTGRAAAPGRNPFSTESLQFLFPPSRGLNDFNGDQAMFFRYVVREAADQFMDFYELTGNGMWAWRAIEFGSQVAELEPLSPRIAKLLQRWARLYVDGSSPAQVFEAMGLRNPRGGRNYQKQYLSEHAQIHAVQQYAIAVRAMELREPGAAQTKKEALRQVAAETGREPEAIKKLIQRWLKKKKTRGIAAPRGFQSQ